MTSAKSEKILFFVSFFLIILSILLIIFSLFSYFYNRSLLERKIPISLKIGNHTGFNISKTTLNFGTIAFGSNAERKIILENNYSFPVKFSFSVEGNVTALLVFDKNLIILPKKNSSFSIKTITPKNKTQEGFYSGILFVTAKKYSS